MTLLAVGASVLAGYAVYKLRSYIKGTQFGENVSALGKVAVVTGATSGIGLETVRELNLRGATVYMLCRNQQRAESAKEKLTKGGCNPDRLIIKHVDLCDFASIRAFAKVFRKDENVVDILVNNAGIMFYPQFDLTVDGYERTWQTNYLGHFLLTELLLPQLRKAQNGRIINVTSSLHKSADTVDFVVANDPARFNVDMAYARSKLAQAMHAQELSRRLRLHDRRTRVTINAVHPGFCSTNLNRNHMFSKTPVRQLFALPYWFFTKTARDGAQSVLYLCLSEAVNFISGEYFGECSIQEPSENVSNSAVADMLYLCSYEAAGVANSLKYVESA